MFDGFWHGLLGGLFGPAVAQWMSRFKYWVIFLVTMFGMHIGFFLLGTYEKGLQFATQAMLKNTLTPVGILVPAGAGLFAVFVSFLGSFNTRTQENEAKDVEKDK